MVLTVEGKSVCSLVTKLSVRRWMLALSTVCGAQSNNAETPGGGAARGRDDAHSKGPDVSGDDNKYVKHRKPPSVCDNTHFCLCQSLAASFPLAQFLRELCSQFKPNHRIHDEAQLNHPGTYNKGLLPDKPVKKPGFNLRSFSYREEKEDGALCSNKDINKHEWFKHVRREAETVLWEQCTAACTHLYTSAHICTHLHTSVPMVRVS